MRTIIFCLLTAVSALSTLYAQEASNTITTATPFLLIAPDARAGGMGDIGVASSPDAYSLHWNASKFAFMPTEMSVAATYTPWLRQLTDDMFLGSVSMARRIDDRSAWAASLNFFNLGQIELTDDNAFPLGTEMLNEFSIDGAYALKLSDHFSMGVALRYIRSDLGITSTNSSIKAVNTYAV
ncbi:MAG: PorV/PorQ family protein, partial [Lutibacter sp.]|nr:PorV/PorQ family protein [Lutibacter sp.]